MIQFWENLVTNGTDGQKDGQTDESGFIGRCPTDIERPIKSKFVVKVRNFIILRLKRNFLFIILLYWWSCGNLALESYFSHYIYLFLFLYIFFTYYYFY